PWATLPSLSLPRPASFFPPPRGPPRSPLFPYTTLFRSATTREAMRQVRLALGPDALIVSNKRVNGGVEILATDSTANVSGTATPDRKSTRLNSSHVKTSYAVFCLKTKIPVAQCGQQIIL